MNKPLLIGIGFLVNALFGPLCMASMMQEADAASSEQAAQHHHHETSDCADCDDTDTQPSDCAGHCMSQAKNVSPSHAAVLPPSKGGITPISYAAEFDITTLESDAQSPVFSPPFLIAVASTVLRL